MRPKQVAAEDQDDLFRARLEDLVDRRHPLVRLAGLIDWGRFETEFGALYVDGGRPGLPTRLMVGLHLLKHMDGLSDESARTRARPHADRRWRAILRRSCGNPPPGAVHQTPLISPRAKPGFSSASEPVRRVLQSVV